MTRALLLSHGEVPALVEAVQDMAREGAASERVRALLGEAARLVERSEGRRGTPREVFERAYDLALQRYTYLPDPGDAQLDERRGAELVQSPALTLEQGFGDCEDAATLVLALALGVGLPGCVVLVERDGEAIHAFAEVTLAPGVVATADLAQYLPLGESWPFGAGFTLHRRCLTTDGRRGVGFLDSLIGGVLNLFASKNNREGAQAQAEAAVEAARQQRAGLADAARIQAEASRKQSAAALEVATLSGLVEAGRIKSTERVLNRVLDVGRAAAPFVLATVGVVALAPVLVNLTAPRRSSPARNAEPSMGHRSAHAGRRAARSHPTHSKKYHTRGSGRPGVRAHRRAHAGKARRRRAA